MRQYLSTHVWWRVSSIYVGVVLIVLSVYMFTGNGILEGELPTAHATQHTVVADAHIASPVHISIPSQSIDLPIARGEYDMKSGWSVAKLTANYIPSTTSLGEPGSVTIYGHDTLEVFHKIKDMQPGAEVDITSQDGVIHRYERNASAARIVMPDDVSILNEKTTTHKIYLLTCEGWRSEKRYVVALSPVEKK